MVIIKELDSLKDYFSHFHINNIKEFSYATYLTEKNNVGCIRFGFDIYLSWAEMSRQM